MTVDSYLELFTTLFGWTFYGILWDVLVGTGIVFLPFLGILIDNWREPAGSLVPSPGCRCGAWNWSSSLHYWWWYWPDSQRH
jgi:hypothetical protein